VASSSQRLTPELRALTVNLIATELFRAKERGRKLAHLGTVRGRHASGNVGKRQRLNLSEMVAGPTRLELATSGVTGRRSNQLNYDPAKGLTLKLLIVD
jgi:hypothetical protein